MTEDRSSERKPGVGGILDVIASETQDMTRETIKAMREESTIASELASHLAQAYSVNGWTSAMEAYWIHQADLYRRWWGRLIDHQRRLLQKVTDVSAATNAKRSAADHPEQAGSA
jgi:hypothetical protein